MSRILLLFASISFLSSCGLICSEQKVTEVSSSDGRYVAALFERDCGATNRFVYHVNLREERSWFWRNIKGAIVEGEVFVSGHREVSLRWVGERELLIQCDSCPPDERVFLKNSWEGVRILFQPRQRP